MNSSSMSSRSMRTAAVLLASVALTGAGVATAKKYRYENITDEEVREIQGVVKELKPGAIVHIGPVTEGCACEDGPSCTYEVWVVAYEPKRSTGLRLSKMMGHWVAGPLQAWEIELAKLREEERTMMRRLWGTKEYPKWRHGFDLRQIALFDARPRCTPNSALERAREG